MTEHLPQGRGGIILNSEITHPIKSINLPLYRNNNCLFNSCTSCGWRSI